MPVASSLHMLAFRTSPSFRVHSIATHRLAQPVCKARTTADKASLDLVDSRRPTQQHIVHEADWEVYWMFNGWTGIYDRLVQELPAWAKPRLNDPSQSILSQVARAQVLVPTMCVISAEVMDAAHDLKLILQPARGISNIDLEAAKKRGIAVCNSPGINAATTAEGALTMMLMLARRVHEQEELFRQRGMGDRSDMGVAMQLSGKTLGIIGMGANGVRVARVAEAMGMTVIGLNSRSTQEELFQMLQQADVVSLHCPLTPDTYHLLGQREFKLMKKGALLVNVARGHIVDKQALTDALMSGHLGGAGIDVHWEEPTDPNELLYQLPNVIATPHTGATSTTVYDEMAKLLTQNIIRHRDGLDLLHRLV